MNRLRPVLHYEIQFAREAANGNAAKQILRCTNSGGNLLSYTKNVRLLAFKDTIGFHKNVLDHKLEVLNHQYSYKALVTNPDDNLKNALRLSGPGTYFTLTQGH